jgi:hypothetical protein
MDQFVDRFSGCAIASGHFSRPSTSILGERALQRIWQFELGTDFDLMCAENRMQSRCKSHPATQLDCGGMTFCFSSSVVTSFVSSLILFITELLSNVLVVPVQTSSPSGFPVA